MKFSLYNIQDRKYGNRIKMRKGDCFNTRVQSIFKICLGF